MSSPIVEFYAGRRPDYLGRTLADILAYDHDRLEDEHDFIQVLFPNFERSGVTPDAPTLTPEVVTAFRQDDALRASLDRAFHLMLGFYGFARDPATGTIVRSPDFDRRAANWATPHNHNHLRITRILKALGCLGLPDRAAAFLLALENVYRERGRAIGERTVGFWRDAVADPAGGRMLS